MMAPAIHGSLNPMASPMPMNAMPMVAMVVHELPVITDMSAHVAHATTKNVWGLRMLRPNVISVGTTPDSIHDEATRAMQMSIGTAGSIWEALRRMPIMAPRRETVRVPSASP